MQGEWKPAFRKLKKKQETRFWWSIGHSSFIVKQDEYPQYIAYQTSYSMKHFLKECEDLSQTNE